MKNENKQEEYLKHFVMKNFNNVFGSQKVGKLKLYKKTTKTVDIS